MYFIITTLTQKQYLGITMKYDGFFSIAIARCVSKLNKTRKAYFKIKKHLGLNNPCRLLHCP